MTRAAATLSDSRNKVVINSSVGNDENSVGFAVYSVASRIISPKQMLKVKRISSAKDGSGTTTIARMRTKPDGPARDGKCRRTAAILKPPAAGAAGMLMTASPEIHSE